MRIDALFGMDWLRAPVAPGIGPKRIVFGSLKGGVWQINRSLQLLAAPTYRALGKRVLAIDLDLEAPGVGFMLFAWLGGSGERSPPSLRRHRLLTTENGLDGVSRR